MPPATVKQQTRQVKTAVFATAIPNTGVRTLMGSVRLPADLDTFITDFGNSIQYNANANFITFDVVANGSPIPDFSNLNTQIAPSTQPRHWFQGSEPPIGKVQLIEVYGTLAVGAPTTPDTFSVQITLVSVTPGTRP